ncbi:S1 family peptidase [Deminuibacter soli]|uniref:Serine protease n=1 Tax=Deminuibacter soli TaxID=2291815 RepID=A0A3E1NIK1_9BACT|nr:serine protease [Deminuibacter soli]RFM27776.1 serine protease [Deminuibacter soli]
MKTLLRMLFLLVLPVFTFCQNEQRLAIAEAMSNTFNLYGDEATGTCFIVAKGGKQYFITAAHLFASSHTSGDQVAIQLVVQKQLKAFDAHVYFHADRKVDVAIVTLPGTVSQHVELPEELVKYEDTLQKVFQGHGMLMDSTMITIGEDVLFFGFPLGNLGTEALGIKFPLVKKAMISGWVKHNGLELLLLDGHNNAGFSGGPIATYDSSTKKMSVAGVVSGYIPEPMDVQRKNETLSVNGNSGIIVCYGKRYIEEIFARYKKELR